MVYPPAEDSYLLSKELERYFFSLKDKNIKILDVGSGTGIQAETCIKSGINKKDITCLDIDEEAIAILKKKNLFAIKSDLFSILRKDRKFDLIIFNAPYLPEDKAGYDRGLDTTAGKYGYELILKFLDQARSFLSKEGKIFLLISSLSKPIVIARGAKRFGFHVVKLAEEKLFFEKLFVWCLDQGVRSKSLETGG